MRIKLFKMMSISTFIVLIGGCYQANLMIRVQSDGSGIIEEKFIMSREILRNAGSMMSRFMTGETGVSRSAGKDYIPNIFNEQKLKNWASLYGEGVQYLSGERICDGECEGFKVFYQFSDVCNLKISQNPCRNVPSNFLAALNRSEQSEGQYRFHFKEGSPSKLIIKRISVAFDNQGAISENVNRIPPSEEDVENAIPLLKQIFEPMRVTIRIEVNGEIVYTNAAYQDDSLITLMDVRFRELNQSPELLRQLLQSPDRGYMHAFDMTKKMSGIQLDGNEEIVVEFE